MIIKNFWVRNRIIFVTFFVAIAIMLFAFAVNGLYPFGDRQILVIDAWHQYYPFLSVFQEKLQTGGSLLYSHDIGLGNNFYLLSSYYNNSPLNFLTVFFPRGSLREFMMIATAIKIALAAAFSAIYLRYLYKRSGALLVVFSLLYAFSAFFMGYYWCIMWLDAAALLPLIIMGLHKAMKGESELQYILTLALAIISNYYIAYMVCLFIAIYYIYLSFTFHRPTSIWQFVKTSSHIVICSLIAVGISAFVLYPTIKGMQLASSAKFTFPSKFKFNGDLMTMVERMFVGQKPSVVKGDPNLYTGALGILMTFLYLTISRVKVREKVASFLLLLFMLVSLTAIPINFIWHGFHYTNGIPFRYAFIFSFLIMSFAYRGLIFMHFGRAKYIPMAIVGIIIYLFLGDRAGLAKTVVYSGIATALVYGVSVYLYNDSQLRKKTFNIILLVAVILEMTASAIVGVAVTGTSKRSSYPLDSKDYKKIIESIEDFDKSDYRMETMKPYSTNDSSLYGYRGGSVFSSTINSKVTDFMVRLGAMAAVRSNRYSVPVGTPVFNSILNIKYFMGRGELGIKKYEGLRELSEEGKVVLYENKYHLPLGFFVPLSATTYNHRGDPFEVQESLFAAFSGQGGELFTTIKENEINGKNMNISPSTGIRNNFKLADSGREGEASLKYEFKEKGNYYFYLYSTKTENATLEIKRGEESSKQVYKPMRGIIIPLGLIEAGNTLNVDFKTKKGQNSFFEYRMVKMDLEKFKNSYNILASRGLEITHFSDTKIEGEIDAPEDGYVYISIPYERGWSLKVNGNSQNLSGLKDALMLVPVKAGQNSISLSYLPDGLRPGLMISAIMLLTALIMTGKFDFLFSSKKKSKRQAELVQEQENLATREVQEVKEVQEVQEVQKVKGMHRAQEVPPLSEIEPELIEIERQEDQGMDQAIEIKIGDGDKNGNN